MENLKINWNNFFGSNSILFNLNKYFHRLMTPKVYFHVPKCTFNYDPI